MARRLAWSLARAVATAAGFPLSFDLRTLLALVFGNAIGLAAAKAWAPHGIAAVAAIAWFALWSLVILGFAAAQEARQARRENVK